MSNDVSRDSVKLRCITSRNEQDNISKKNNLGSEKAGKHCLSAASKPYTDNSYNRLRKLKLAIISGRFKINAVRVAEKFIQFESQLSL